MHATAAPQGMKTFLLIWLGELVSIIGSAMSFFALGVWVFQKTGQATAFALTAFFSYLPMLLMSPLAGSLADRWNRRWLMILGDTGAALCTLVVVVLVARGSLEIWHIYLLSFLSAACSAFQEPAYSASVTMLVPKKDLARASGLIQAGLSISNLVAPALAGTLFLWIGLRGIVLIDFLTFFAAVGVLLFVRIPQPATLEEDGETSSHASQGTEPKEPGKLQALRDMRFSWRYLWQRQGLFWLLWYFALVNFLLNVAGVLEGPLVLSFSNSAMLGVVETATGAGMLLGSLVISAWGGPKQRVPAIMGFLALAAIGLIVTGLRPQVVFPAVGMFVLMFNIPISSANNQALFQSKIAPGVQGRVFAMRRMISQSMIPLAYLVAGPLADHVIPGLLHVEPGHSTGVVFILSGTLLFFASGLAMLNPRIRLLEQRLPNEVEAAPVPEN